MDKIIKMDANENPIKHKINIGEIVQGINPRLYPDVTCSKIINKIASFYNISSSEVVCTNGSDMLIKIITSSLVKPGNTIIMPNIAFPTYEIAAKLYRYSYYLSPLKNYGIDLDDIIQNIDETTSLIWISNPHNPTGTLLPYREIIDFLNKVPSHINVVLDEAYAEYVDGMLLESLDLRKKYPNLIIIRTLSKAYGLAGARIGYGIAETNIINKIKEFIGPFDLNSYAQELGVQVIGEQDYVNDVREYTKNEMNKIENHCKKCKIEYIKSYANFIMIKTKDNPDKLEKILFDRGLKIKNGKYIGLPGWIRVSINKSYYNDILIKTLVNNQIE
ncbi:histidinol-phosphate transaminase [Clostridium sp. AL.422]|uniref:pyridoxal phosphate-dependent aminotransferase n=1 Tax=Clostridium TaxID=1485 RepID=UPI00293DADAE|nr:MULTISPECIES: histidinol-phosphate transaminase [unclassified Clostridium]MDV4152539.1 histidinol-phosphate transaminase [Clostridium sp. AL.422]